MALAASTSHGALLINDSTDSSNWYQSGTGIGEVIGHSFGTTSRTRNYMN